MKTAARVSLLFLSILSVSVPAFPAYDEYIEINGEGWTESAAVCINSRGDVAGYAVTAQGERGFLWSGGTIRTIVPPGADGARATWVNGNGDIAGTAVTGGVPHAFLLRAGQYMDPTPGWAFSTAVFVAEDGTVAGSGERGAYISRNGAPVILSGFTAVLGGNAAGHLVGTKDNAAWLYVPGTGYTDVTPPLAVEAFPNAINETGLIAITSSSGGARKGFVYSGGWFIQMTPQGWDASQATAVNNHAAVAGFGDSLGTRLSFVRAGASYDYIAFPGWTATEAVSLNDLGQVAGSGLTASGERRAFVASPAGLSTADVPGQGTPAPAPAGGGCSMAPRAGRSGASSGAAADAAILVLPLFVLLARRLGNRPA